MDKIIRLALLTAFFLFCSVSVSYAHLCDNVFRQVDKLIVKPETYNLVVKDKTTFKIFLQNNMDRGIAEISMCPDSPAFDFTITPEKMTIPKDQRVFFEVTMRPKPNIKTGSYPINFRLVGGGREFKAFTLRTKESTDQEAKKEEKVAGMKDISKLLQVKPAPYSAKLDGSLNEECWKSAGVASNFSSESGGGTRYQTTVLVACDEEYLYFGVYCQDDNTEKLSADDKVKILLTQEISGYPYYSISLPAVGSASFKKNLQYKSSAPWENHGVGYFIKKDKTSWTVEVAVPFSALNTGPPVSEGIWYLRIVRVKAGEFAEKSYWSADSSGYNNTKGFGEFVVFPYNLKK